MSSLKARATPFLPAISSLPTLDDGALASTLDLLFENSPELHSLAIPTLRDMSFTSYDGLITTMRDLLLKVVDNATVDADARRVLYGVVASHPRLGAAKPEALSEQSRAEQAGLRGAAGEEEEDVLVLACMNDEYECRFPGLRYVTFVKGRGRDVIFEDMRRRINRGDVRAEAREAIEAMCDIAKDRAAKLQTAAPAVTE